MTTGNVQAEDDVFNGLRRFFTFDRALMIGSMVFAAGMWWNAQSVRAAQIDEQFALDRERLVKLEKRDEERLAQRLQDQVDRAEVAVKLSHIQLDLNSLRDELKEIGRKTR